MVRRLEAITLSVFRVLEEGFNRMFGQRWNPWYQLGALSYYFFWIVAFSGIYLFIFFDTSIQGAYQSMEQLTHRQWWLGGIMRSLHRYASDAMAITVTLHLLREFGLGRFRGARWFSWFSGVPLLWLMFAAAIGGYWLVWDELAQYIAVATTEWLDWLPSLSDPLARNFLSDETLSDRLFSLLVFMHVAIPLFLLFGMFIHIKRLKLAKTGTARGLAIGTMAALLSLSLIKPAVSMGAADMSKTVALVNIDWIYMNVYPLLDSWGPAGVWLLLVGISAALAVLPWLSPEKKGERIPAQVDPQNCNGCSWCFQDCPYEAITMIAHESKNGRRQAQVNPDLCTACGICAGACPSATPFRHVDELISGIEMPDFSVNRLKDETERKLAQLNGDNRVMVFGCDHALDIGCLETSGVAALNLPCIAQLPPSFADYVSRNEKVDGVMITGCGEDCFFRLGTRWTEERFHALRMPHLRTRAGHHKVKLCWAGSGEKHRLQAALDDYRRDLGAGQGKTFDEVSNG